jgi:hypothetical protein
VKWWEIIADKLSKAGWTCGCVSAIDSNGRTIWIADAHRDNGNRLVVRADEKLTAFLELECAIRASDESPRRAGTIRLSSRPKKSDYTIVADLRWQTLALAFTGAGVRRAGKVFPPNELDQPRSWLAE